MGENQLALSPVEEKCRRSVRPVAATIDADGTRDLIHYAGMAWRFPAGVSRLMEQTWFPPPGRCMGMEPRLHGARRGEAQWQLYETTSAADATLDAWRQRLSPSFEVAHAAKDSVSTARAVLQCAVSRRMQRRACSMAEVIRSSNQSGLSDALVKQIFRTISDSFYKSIRFLDAYSSALQGSYSVFNGSLIRLKPNHWLNRFVIEI